MPPRAFVSFEMEDKWARDFLVQHSKDRRTDIAFVDYSVQEPFDSAWKTKCKERIARTKGTIVLVGATTYKSSAVLWEIEETSRQKHYMFGIQINKDKTHPIPSRPKGTTCWGPNNGLLVPVKEKDGDFVFPDVADWLQYTFDPDVPFARPFDCRRNHWSSGRLPGGTGGSRNASFEPG